MEGRLLSTWGLTAAPEPHQTLSDQIHPSQSVGSRVPVTATGGMKLAEAGESD